MGVIERWVAAEEGLRKGDRRVNEGEESEGLKLVPWVLVSFL